MRQVLGAIGDRVRDARVAANLTQEAAAAMAGIDVKRWQRIERGDVNVTVRTLVRIAQACGTTIWQIMSLDGHSRTPTPE